MKPIVFFALSLFAGFISGCGEKKKFSEYSEGFRKLARADEGIFRGYEPGMSFQAVKNAEPGRPVQEEKDYLFYEYREKNGEMFTLEFVFDQGILQEFRLDGYYIAKGDARTLFLEIKEFFESRYGEGEDYFGFSGWVLKKNDRLIYCELKDESSEYRQGKLSLFVYKHEEPTAPKPNAVLPDPENP